MKGEDTKSTTALNRKKARKKTGIIHTNPNSRSKDIIKEKQQEKKKNDLQRLHLRANPASQ